MNFEFDNKSHPVIENQPRLKKIMTLEIDKRVIDSTNCENSFRCMGSPDFLCKVRESIEDDLHFIKCTE